MEAEAEKKLQASIAAVTQLHREQKIGPDDYHKCLVCLAFEFSAAGEHLRAAGLLQGVPLAYFQKVQRTQMAEDSNYAYVSYSLALNLVQGGIVHLGPAVAPTQAAASA